MRRLILMRHGEAERRADGGGDFDRRLTARGAADSAAVAHALAVRGFPPSVALVSSAVRTVETWEAAAPAFPGVRPSFLRALYDAEAQRLWEVFSESTSPTVLLVAHNPGVHNLAASLGLRAGGPDASRLARDFPPGAAAVFSMPPGGVHLEAVLFPADLTGDAGDAA